MKNNSLERNIHICQRSQGAPSVPVPAPSQFPAYHVNACSRYVHAPRPLSLPSPTATLPPTLTASLGAPLAARAGHAGVTGDVAHRRRRRRCRPTSHRPLHAASRCPLGTLAAALYVSPPGGRDVTCALYRTHCQLGRTGLCLFCFWMGLSDILEGLPEWSWTSR